MAKANIKTKIRTGFILVFLITLAVTLYLFIQLRTIGNDTKLFYQHPYVVSNAVNDIKIEIYQTARWVRDIQFADNVRQLNSLMTQIVSSDENIHKGFKIISAQYLGNKNDIDSAINAYTAWENTGSIFYQLKKEKKIDSIEYLIKTNTRLKFDKIIGSLTVISDFAKNKADTTMKHVIKDENDSLFISIVLLAVSAILVFFFIWYLSRSITKPIKLFVNEANELLNSKEKTESKIHHDDVELLFLTLAELKKAYKSIEQQNLDTGNDNDQLLGLNSDLEGEATIRTAELITANKELLFQNKEKEKRAAELIIANKELAFQNEEKEKRAAELTKSKQLLEETGRLGKVGGWEFDIKENKLSWSDIVYQIHEVEPDYQPTVESAINFYSHEARPVIYKAVRLAIEEGKSFDLDLQFITVKQNKIWVRIIGQAYYINGEIIKIGGVFQDITERKLAQEVFSDLIEKNPMSIQIIDKDGFTLKTNSAYTSLFGAEPPPDFSIFADLKRKGFDELILLAKKGEVVHFPDIPYNVHDIFPELTDQPVWIRAVLFSLKDNTGKQEKFVFMHENITDRKQAEEELISANKDLFFQNIEKGKRAAELIIANKELAFQNEEKEKRAAELIITNEGIIIQNKKLYNQNKELEQFAYIASHDLQEPLRSLTSFVELLQNEFKNKIDEQADTYLDFISKSSNRMQELVKGLMDYSRIGKEKVITSIDCNQIVKEVLSDLTVLIRESDAKIIVNDLPVLNGYSTELRQLFQNLISNALKFRKKDIAPEILISASEQDKMWRFAIQDNGIGIDEKYKEKIFIIFKRIHNRNEYEGTGIGLSLCKKIAELHNGSIWVESKINKGSIFYFTIQ